MKKIALLISHATVFAAGFALGVYLLPTLIAPPAPAQADVAQAAQKAQYQTSFIKDLAGSDFLHWGEGQVSLSASEVTLMGELAPGPDYKLYLVPLFVEDETQFAAVKDQSLRIGTVNTFKNFIVPMPVGVALDDYNTVLVWCETFGEFITAARYR